MSDSFTNLINNITISNIVGPFRENIKKQLSRPSKIQHLTLCRFTDLISLYLSPSVIIVEPLMFVVSTSKSRTITFAW